MRWISISICVMSLWSGPGFRDGRALRGDDRPTVRGPFGDRTLGRPLQPGASRNGGGVQRGPYGSILGLSRGDAGSMLRTPWRRVEPMPVFINTGPAPYLYAAPGARPMVVPQQQPGPAPGDQPLPAWMSNPGEPASDIWFRVPAPSSETTTPVAPGDSGFYRPRESPGWSVIGIPVSGSTGAKGPFQPSPSVSARITRLAHAGGAPASSGMQVSVQGDTATVRGTVATPHQRDVVGNLVRLESGVWNVDNQVIVVAAPAQAAAEVSR